MTTSKRRRVILIRAAPVEELGRFAGEGGEDVDAGPFADVFRKEFGGARASDGFDGQSGGVHKLLARLAQGERWAERIIEFDFHVFCCPVRLNANVMPPCLLPLNPSKPGLFPEPVSNDAVWLCCNCSPANSCDRTSEGMRRGFGEIPIYSFAILLKSAVVDLPGTKGMMTILPPADSTSRRSSWFNVSRV